VRYDQVVQSKWRLVEDALEGLNAAGMAAPYMESGDAGRHMLVRKTGWKVRETTILWRLLGDVHGVSSRFSARGRRQFLVRRPALP
jgi:hypothetical protein